jgi:hypothetical protein
MAAKKQTPQEAALDAQLFSLLTSAGAVEVEDEPEKKPAAPAPKPASAGWGPKAK